jgi:serine protease Do
MTIHHRDALRTAGDRLRRWVLGCLLVILAGHPGVGAAQSANVKAIEHVKPSIVAVGTFARLRNPEFRFRGTGFAVGDGSVVATNEHVVPTVLAVKDEEKLAVAVRASDGTIQVRGARQVASEPSADLALLKIDGPPLPPLQIADSDSVREGEVYLFTGFPIGTVLGLIPATSRAMISAITPIVIPAARAGRLSARAIRRLAAGAFPVFQLDGTAYPGNSGSPLYDPHSRKVVGIVNMVFVKGTKEAALTKPSGISYAIPARKLRELLDSSR